MKKLRVLLSVLMGFMCLVGCDFSKNHSEVLAETEFDGMKITFYYDSTVSNNFGIYYVNDLDGYQHPTYETIKSSDQKTIFYIDETGTNLIYENNQKISPVEYVELKTKDVQWKLAVYHLAAEKEYWMIGPNQKDYRILSCTASATGQSSVCSGGFEMEKETYLDMLNSWQKVDVVNDTLEFELFMSVRNNWTNITDAGLMAEDWLFSKSEQEDGSWVVYVEGIEKTYYHLDENEVLQLKKLLMDAEGQ